MARRTGHSSRCDCKRSVKNPTRACSHRLPGLTAEPRGLIAYRLWLRSQITTAGSLTAIATACRLVPSSHLHDNCSVNVEPIVASEPIEPMSQAGHRANLSIAYRPVRLSRRQYPQRSGDANLIPRRSESSPGRGCAAFEPIEPMSHMGHRANLSIAYRPVRLSRRQYPQRSGDTNLIPRRSESSPGRGCAAFEPIEPMSQMGHRANLSIAYRPVRPQGDNTRNAAERQISLQGEVSHPQEGDARVGCH
ncbi:uncharacterized protein L969DRAFT_48871 [Mixia osmundae IAM 14324]|uniref:Uncharacterized protein n=1 Tax=Mixia osmundae (strain CBS 9802 / IAM 14324 / JCM 22182 / KY 12970) TaxID=764103 RepID=G7DVT4_MIXOS|nr:uncharacterized protein L969DRAFT_48871 [Mixia osmundae IAM 14324]KEI39625.1 hypothetical protein L969DRAFT_48871 [Mixia osmundae IAM 14324]GAA94694.1 hypothetical protein E5Q_01347 [Mixia osmundae IAM 14324]